MSVGGIGGFNPANGLASRILSQADTDVNGGLSLEEFGATSQTDASDEDISNLFNTLDSNSDGLVSGDELATGISQLSSDTASSLLSAQEFGAGGPPPPPGGHGGPGGPGGPSGQRGGGGDFFSDTDTDSSGTLSLDEFTAKGDEIGISSEDSQTLFSTIDSDGDGEISEEEDQSYRQAQAEERGAGGPPPPPPGGGGPGGAQGFGGGSDLASILASSSAYSSSSSSTIDLVSLFDQAA